MLLGFDDDTLKFFENREVLVGRVYFSVSLLLARQETDFFETLELTLDIARVFLDELGEPSHVRVKVRVFRVHDYDFSPHPRGDKNV